jgi:hypothetical protein
MEFPNFPRLIQDKINYYIWQSNKLEIKNLKRRVDFFYNELYELLRRDDGSMQECYICNYPYFTDYVPPIRCSICDIYDYCQFCVDEIHFKKCICCGNNTICDGCWENIHIERGSMEYICC